MFYHTNLIKLDVLGLLRQSNEGGATDYNNWYFERGYLTGLFFIFNQFHQLKQATKRLQGVPPHGFFSSPASLQNQSQLLLVLQKKKALPEGGQQINSKNESDQDQVIIFRWNGYRTQ